MDPMTMMAIANFGMQMMNKGGQGQQQQQPAQPPQMPQPKPFAPGPLPAMNNTDYGGVIKNMLSQTGNPAMPNMAGISF